MVTIGYVRVSTRSQHYGQDAQKEDIRRHCRGEPDAWVEEVISGGVPISRRHGLLAAIRTLGKGDRLVIGKRDRLARSVMASAIARHMVERKGAVIESADGAGNGGDPGDQLMVDILAAFAEYERAQIAARTSAALAVKKSRLEKTGGHRPYGFWVGVGEGGTMVLRVSPSEMAVVREMRWDRAAGCSDAMIARKLNGRGQPAPRGGLWHAKTIWRILGPSSPQTNYLNGQSPV